MAKRNYDNWSKEELVREVEKLEKKLKKNYGLVWEDKLEDVASLCKEKLPILAEDKKKAINTDEDKPTNILIEGDNYHALSVLNYTHKGKVDVVYIDPPYNTGNKDFIYNDKYVDMEDDYRHSKWISFMAKRLKLAKILLRDTGVIFISIDDNEVAQLKMLMDDSSLFGEGNFLTNFIWRRTKTPPRLSKNVAHVHDYIVCYARNIKALELNKIPLKESYIRKTYKNPDNDPRGDWRLVPLLQPANSPNKEFELTMPDGRAIKGKWRCSRETFKSYIQSNLLVISKDGVPNRKLFLSETSGQIADTWLDNIATNEEASKEIEDLFGSNIYFSSPKPTNLINYLLQISTRKDSVILDFFAGSGTTAQAALKLNKEDGGSRKFILCTNNENNICTDICYPRIKKVIEGYKNSKKEKVEGLGGNLKYFKTDFVDAEPTDRNKKRLVDKSTEMLCLKEDCFEEVKKEGDFKIFKNSQNKYLGIIYDDDGIEPFKKVAKKMKNKFVVYVFSLDESAREEEFEDMADELQLKPIPAVILNVYKRIFK